jgi:hypothetical protein
VGGRGQCLGAGKNSKRGKCLKMPQNPQRQVHALLAGVFCTDPIFSSDFYDSSLELKTFSILLSGTIQIIVINM